MMEGPATSVFEGQLRLPGDHQGVAGEMADLPDNNSPDSQESVMTEQTAHQKAEELTREQVANYLRQNPEFFVDQDELLRSLTLPHDSGRAISLVERQVHLFREQRDTLRRELVELVSIARQNDRLFEKSKRLLMQVIEARTLNDMASAIDDSIRGDFGLDAASVLLFTDADVAGASQGALHVVRPVEAHERLGSLLEGDRAVCGQFRESERASCFRTGKSLLLRWRWYLCAAMSWLGYLPWVAASPAISTRAWVRCF